MTRNPRETALLERFETFYGKAKTPVMEAIERSVCGCDYGGSSWTTREQVERMAHDLALGPGVRLLELGSGSGWPGLYLSKTTGCAVAMVDIPLSGMRIAVQRAAADGLADRVAAVVADAADLPFAGVAFDAVSHCDLLCCLDRKRVVLAACRRAIREGGRMAFTVISVAPGLSAADHRRAVANGPDFIEADAAYPDMLGEAGWSVIRQDDITAAYIASCRRQIAADETQREGLVALLGEGVFAERMAGWRSKLAAAEAGLLRREAFLATPRDA